VEVSHNSPGRAPGREDSMRLRASFLRRAGEARDEILERRHWENGAMQRDVRYVKPNSVDHAIDVCITFAFAGGRISAVRGCVDGRALALLGLSAARLPAVAVPRLKGAQIAGFSACTRATPLDATGNTAR
jgi:hypothetical protein